MQIIIEMENWSSESSENCRETLSDDDKKKNNRRTLKIVMKKLDDASFISLLPSYADYWVLKRRECEISFEAQR